MKSGSATTGGTVPLQKRKAGPSATPRKRSEMNGPVRKEKRDRVKEYMEQKFYEQFMPKRDASSRIRKLSLDKNALRQKKFQKRQPTTEGAGGTCGISSKKGKKGLHAAQEQKRKRRQPRVKSAKEICSMVGSLDSAAPSWLEVELSASLIDLKAGHSYFFS